MLFSYFSSAIKLIAIMEAEKKDSATLEASRCKYPLNAVLHISK